MKALLKDDTIVKPLNDGVDIGPVPKGVGLERLRFDGHRTVDLIDLDKIWVRFRKGRFELHVVPLEDCQLVSMRYGDRKNLVVDVNGTIKVRNEQEQDDERMRLRKAMARAFLNSKVREKVGDTDKRIMSLLILVCSLVIYARTQPSQLGAFYDRIIPHILDAFPLSRWEQELTDSLRELKTVVEEYYVEVDKVT